MPPQQFPLIGDQWVAVIEPALCQGHGRCVAVCPFRARSLVEGKIYTGGCIGCGLCEFVCPEKAISMKHPAHGKGKNGWNYGA